jgi:hypothetical protein
MFLIAAYLFLSFFPDEVEDRNKHLVLLAAVMLDILYIKTEFCSSLGE